MKVYYYGITWEWLNGCERFIGVSRVENFLVLIKKDQITKKVRIKELKKSPEG
jgi:hypothetical protein